MRVVDQDPSTVELALHQGKVRCPACRESLRPWGRARTRPIRLGAGGNRAVRPRRARCPACRTTHVLLPDWMVVRRAYAAPVIWDVLAAHSRGLGYRRIAVSCDLPETTVRDWLRALRRTPRRRPPHAADPARGGACPAAATTALAPGPSKVRRDVVVGRSGRILVRRGCGRLAPGGLIPLARRPDRVGARPAPEPANTSPPRPDTSLPSDRPP